MTTDPIESNTVPSTPKSVVFNGNVLIQIFGAIVAAGVGALPQMADLLPKGVYALLWLGFMLVGAGWGAFIQAQKNALVVENAALRDALAK